MNITRLLARQLRAVLRRAGVGKTAGGFGPRILFQADADTMRVRASSSEVAIEYRLPGSFAPVEAWLPVNILNDCEGTRPDPVTIEPHGANKFQVTWTDRGIPQVRDYSNERPVREEAFPGVSEQPIVHSPGLLKAFRNALETVDYNSSRYALNCVQLDGPKGEIQSTDGRQILTQAGFQFPWPDALLIPASKVFASSEFPPNQPVLIGQAGEWVSLVIGPWTIWLRIQRESRFPKLHDVINPPDAASSNLRLSPEDARFLIDALPRMPVEDGSENTPITLDLNGQVFVRSRIAAGAPPTELTLTNSRLSGEPVVLNSDRKFLLRALKLGFQEISIYGNERPLQCHDAHRHYVWAPISPESPVQGSSDAICIQSPTQENPQKNSLAESVPPTGPVNRIKTMPKSKSTTQPPAHTPATATGATAAGTTTTAAASGTRQLPAVAEQHSSEQTSAEPGSPIERAILLKQSLRDTLHQTDELIQALKHQKRHSKLVATTLASLKQLQAVG